MRRRKAWAKLNFKVSLPELIKEFRKVEELKIRYRHGNEIGKNHALSIVSATGKQAYFRPFSQGKIYSPTPVAKMLPKTLKFLQKLPGPLFSVRYLISEPDSGLRYHRDMNINPGYGLVRLHIPLVTDPKARFYVEDQNFHLPPGSLYFVDVGRFHAIENRSEITRVHLVIDIGWTRELEKIFSASSLKDLKKIHKPSYFPWPASDTGGSPKLIPGTYRIDSRVRPESLNFQKTDKFKIVQTSDSFYFEDQNRIRFAIDRLDSRWCFCPSLGPGFRFKQKGKRLHVELRGVVEPIDNGKTKFIKLTSE